MKTAGALLSLILATTLLAAEPSSTPSPADPAAVPIPAPAPTTAPVPLPAPSPSGATVAKPAPADPADKLSPQVSQMLNANLPKFDPAVPTPAKPTAEASADAIELPKMIVKQKKRPRLGDEVMMTNKAFNEKLAKEKTSSFDRDFLNKYGFLGGASAAERAREEYNRAQKDQMMQDVSVLAKALDQEDPAAAKALRDAANKP